MEKKYIVRAKVGDEKFVKYHVNNLVLFTKFLDEKFAGWRWFNVYIKDTEKQIANFTSKNRPTTRYV